MTDAERLDAGARAMGVALAAADRDKLLAFAALLRSWSRAFNLVSRRDVGRLVDRHLLDALSLSPLLRGRRVIDLGTGAGLPGIPLAIVGQDRQFTLIDRSERRMRFVRHATMELQLVNTQCVVGDFASFRPTTLFDTVVSRAVAEPNALWRVAKSLLGAEGQALFQVGSRQHVESPDDADALVESIPIHAPTPRRVLRITRPPTKDIDA